MVGVISKPINFSEKTAIATKTPLNPCEKKPPFAVRFAGSQCPLRNSEMLTIRDIIIMAKKKMFAREPVTPTLKLEMINHKTTIAMAIQTSAPFGIGTK